MRKYAVALLLLLLSPPAWALTVAGVNVPPAVSASGEILSLNGAGIRSKFFVKVYVGALYTGKKVSTSDELLRDPGAKAVRMHFVHRKVEKEKIVEAFAEGLSKNAPEAARSPEAKTFLSWFAEDFVAGDTVGIDLSPDGTLSASRNGKPLGTLRSPALARGVLLIWFGERPADEGLKKGMLGRE
jgi:hypothetical protein